MADNDIDFGNDTRALELDFYFTPSPGDMDQRAVTEALDRAAAVGGEVAFFDPNTGAYTSTPTASSVAVPSPAVFRSVSDRIRSDPELAQIQIDASTGVMTYPDGRVVDPSSNPGLWSKLQGALGETAGFVNGILRTPLGAAAATLGIGALGQVLGSAVAGGPRSLTLPSPQAGQNPALLAGNALTAAALQDPATRADFMAAIQRSISGQATGAGLLQEALAREMEFARSTAPQTSAIRSLAVNELPGFLINQRDIAAFQDLADAVGPELARQLTTRTLYPGQAPAGSTTTTTVQPLPERTEAYGSLGPNHARLQGIYDQVQKGEIKDEGALRAAIGTVPGMNADEINALVRTMAQGLGSTTDTTLVAPNPLDAPLQARARSLAVGSANDFALPVDPAERAMEARLLRAIEGGEVDPATERRIAEDLEVLRNKLKQAYGSAGAEWEGTLGQNLYLKGQESANAQRYAINRDVINSLGPQQQARRTFQITNPQEMYLRNAGLYIPAAQASTTFNQNARAQNEQQRQNAIALLSGIRSGALRDVTNTAAAGAAQRQSLAGFNPVNLSMLQFMPGSFGSAANIGQLSDLNDAASRRAVDQARNQATLAGFNADQASRAATANSIASLFGTAAAEGLRTARGNDVRSLFNIDPNRTLAGTY